MKGFRYRQTRLNIFKALVAIVAIGSLAATGWIIQQHNRNQVAIATAAVTTLSGNQQTAEQQTPNTKPAPTVTYLHIKEWKVKLALDISSESLYYYIKPDMPNVAYLSLKTVSDIAPACAASKTSLGAIVRQTPAEQQSAPDAKYSIKGTTHIGNYWYGFSLPQAGCISPAESAVVQKTLPNFNIGAVSQPFGSLATD